MLVVSSIRIKSLAHGGHKETRLFRVMELFPRIPFAHALSYFVNLMSSFLFSVIVLFKAFDVVIVSVPPPESAVGFHLAFLFCRVFSNRRTKLVYDYRDDILDESMHRHLYRGIYEIDKYFFKILLKVMRLLLERSDAIVCATESLRSFLIERGFDEKKIHVVHNGADTALFKPRNEIEKIALKRKYGLSSDSFALVAVSGVGWIYYKLEPLLAALKLLSVNCNNFYLLIIGSRTLELNSCLELADKLGVRTRVFPLGEIDHREMPDVLNAARSG